MAMTSNQDTLTPGPLLATATVRELRRAAGADEVSKTALAGRLGISRQTMSKRFQQGDMKLSEFFDAALSMNRDPGDILAAATATLNAKEPNS
ncbi:hypothetical protein GFD17_04230 [Bifidobacterium sp. SMB2]|uniref:helix-turn-helix domain-containing protein n=1 Tax=Bifidobacterium sp. SMB2 TaxID=2661626 RepID=UPI0013FA3420|nr:helix-turn-helix domain-containing protein [Bifidobacterium sp. SMB2]NEG95978.1 hypothetical protein [Bifidobacterium sp. SMB2]